MRVARGLLSLHAEGGLPMATRASRTREGRTGETPRYVPFQYGEGRYILSPERSKVYRNWVEVETSRAAEILTAFRHTRQV